jgi:hypothetical protein
MIDMIATTGSADERELSKRRGKFCVEAAGRRRLSLNNRKEMRGYE